MKEMIINIETAKKYIINYTINTNYADKLEILENSEGDYPFTFHYYYFHNDIVNKYVVNYDLEDFMDILKEPFIFKGYDVKWIKISKRKDKIRFKLSFGLENNIKRKRKM